MRVTTLAQGGIASFGLRIVLGGATCPMIDSLAQPNVSRITHNDNARLAAALGDRSGAAQCAKRWIIAPAQRSGPFGDQSGKVDPANTRHGFEDHDVLPLKTVSGCGVSFADRRTDLIKLTFSFPQLTVNKPQTSDQ